LLMILVMLPIVKGAVVGALWAMEAGRGGGTS